MTNEVEQANQQIAKELKKAENSLRKAKKLADEYGLSFNFSLGEASNVDREIGGDYYGKGTDVTDYGYSWNSSDRSGNIEESETGVVRLAIGRWSAWQSSSEQC